MPSTSPTPPCRAAHKPASSSPPHAPLEPVKSSSSVASRQSTGLVCPSATETHCSGAVRAFLVPPTGLMTPLAWEKKGEAWWGACACRRGTTCPRGTGQHELPQPKHLPLPGRAMGPLSELSTSEEMSLWKPWKSPHCLMPPSRCPRLGEGAAGSLRSAAEPLEPSQQRAEEPGDPAHRPSGQTGDKLHPVQPEALP